jgi:voltage-gated potassium channel
VVTLVRAPSKLRYLVTWGWIDLLSSIPAVGPLRYGRIGRLVRVFRIFRVIRSARVIAYFMAGRRAQSVFFTAILVSLLLLMTASIAILQVETTAAGNIKTAEDAMWWAVSTLTTVGSTEVYPVTSAGRLIGAVVMGAGVAMFGIVSGVAAAWFLAPTERREDKDLAELKEMVSGLRADLARQRP